MMNVDDIFNILNKFPMEIRTERIPLSDACGRFLSENVVSPLDSPPFDKAAMDGWAVLEGEKSRNLTILETVAAGDVPSAPLTPGTCTAIMTGAKIPPGTGKIIRVEYTHQENGVVIVETAEPYENIIRQGENLKKGDTVLTPRRLGPGDIGILASLGLDSVPVAIPPRVGIISTGSELREPGIPLKDGEIYNSNGHQLKAQVENCGGLVNYYGIIPDDEKLHYQAIKRGLEENDLLILSGGVSMGEFDYVPRTLKQLSVGEIFYKPAIKPGRPLWFGSSGSCAVFGLPGNPVSTYILFEVFARHLIYRFCGIEYRPEYLSGELGRTISRKTWDRTEFYPVFFRDGKVFPVSYHGSSHLNAMAETHGLLTIDREIRKVKEGETVNVRLL